MLASVILILNLLTLYSLWRLRRATPRLGAATARQTAGQSGKITSSILWPRVKADPTGESPTTAMDTSRGFSFTPIAGAEYSTSQVSDLTQPLPTTWDWPSRPGATPSSTPEEPEAGPSAGGVVEAYRASRAVADEWVPAEVYFRSGTRVNFENNLRRA